MGGEGGQPRPAARAPEGTRIYAVGDIHGRSDLLDLLHARIEEDLGLSPVENAFIIYVGDYVDRGPDSRGVIERLLAPAPASASRILLKGNHEAMLLQFLAAPETGAEWRQFGGMETLLSYGVDIRTMAPDGYAALADQFARKLPAAHLGLFESLKTFTTTGDYFFCHAGVRPGTPLPQQKESDLLWIRDAFLRSDADFGKVVVHGHTPTEELCIRANRICVDAGAYATHRLRCVALEGDRRRFLSARLAPRRETAPAT
jgi:serine/threonine protein phosphatase 1